MSIKMNFELLPNEIIIESLQYLDALNIFYSFDRLNYRFHTLIRNIPLHLNFQQFKKTLFNEFCQIILLNPEIKENIISLQLSNEGKCGQIHSFLSLFSLNEFIHLRSLSLFNLRRDNTEQVLLMLPFLSDLYYLACTSTEPRSLKIMSALTKSKIRKLTIPDFNFNSTFIDETMSITSLTISLCDIIDLCPLLKYIPMLKYLKIEHHLYDYHRGDNELKIPTTNAVHLKELILGYSEISFQILELLLKHTPNLQIFSIFAPKKLELIDANRWQHLIESSLPQLHIFKFNFNYLSAYDYDEMLIKLQQFQTNFWYEQHRWYTNYEINDRSVLIYTIPYVRNDYILSATQRRHSNSLLNSPNEFDNVKNLSFRINAIGKDTTCFFRNVHTLRLISERNYDYYEIGYYKLTTKEIEYLYRIVNISNIKHIIFFDEHLITPLVLLKILKDIPNISSLTTRKSILRSFFNHRTLCQYLNKKIITLDISDYCNNTYIQSYEIDLFYKTFSNLEQLHCHIENLNVLLLILTKFSKLSMLNIEWIDEEIYSWIQVNASALNVYLDFRSRNDNIYDT